MLYKLSFWEFASMQNPILRLFFILVPWNIQMAKKSTFKLISITMECCTLHVSLFIGVS